MTSVPPITANPALSLLGLEDGLAVPRTKAEQKQSSAPGSASDSDAQTPHRKTGSGESDNGEGDLNGPGRIVTVLKTAGGCGASMVAVNLAGEFARLCNEQVALVDLDVQFGNLALYLDMHTRHTLMEALQADARMDETLLRSIMAVHETDVALLAAPRSMVPLDQINDEFIARLLRLLKKAFPVTVIEMPAGWAQWFAGVFDQTDEIIVVCEPELRSASGLTRVVQSLEDMSFVDVPLSVIANKVQKHGDAARRLEQMRSTVRYPMEMISLDEKTVDRAVNAGMLLYQTGPKTKAYKDLSGIVSRLFARLDPRGASGQSNDKSSDRSSNKGLEFRE